MATDPERDISSDPEEDPVLFMEAIIIQGSQEADLDIAVTSEMGGRTFRWTSGGLACSLSPDHSSGVRMLQVIEPCVEGVKVDRFFYCPDGQLVKVYRATVLDGYEVGAEAQITASALVSHDLGLAEPNEEDEEDFVELMFSALGLGKFAS